MSEPGENAHPLGGLMRAEILGLILAILAQSAGAIWWGSQLTARVQALEAKVTASAAQGESIARIDERTKYMDERVARIEAAFEGKGSKP